jgi:YesN/AraC family two-component response regulator
MKILSDSCTPPKRKILIVEDDPEIISFLQGVLSEIYTLKIARCGNEALDELSSVEEEAGVVLLDHRLPDMTGLEVLGELKQRKPHIPVIFVTGYGSEDLAVKAFKGGAKDYLKKPFNYRQLLHAVEFCLSLWQKDNRMQRNLLRPDSFPVVDFLDHVNEETTKYKLQKALIFINNNYMNRLSLDSVAEKACTSKHHFSREFRKYVGCTYREYLNKVRTEKARELLRETNLSVTEAAFSVGYTGLRSFERMFKKTQGCTARQFKDSLAREALPSETPESSS